MSTEGHYRLFNSFKTNITFKHRILYILMVLLFISFTLILFTFLLFLLFQFLSSQLLLFFSLPLILFIFLHSLLLHILSLRLWLLLCLFRWAIRLFIRLTLKQFRYINNFFSTRVIFTVHYNLSSIFNFKLIILQINLCTFRDSIPAYAHISINQNLYRKLYVLQKK